MRTLDATFELSVILFVILASRRIVAELSNARDISLARHDKEQKAYARAGVDVDLGNDSKRRIQSLVARRMAPRFWARSAGSADCSRRIFRNAGAGAGRER